MIITTIPCFPVKGRYDPITHDEIAMISPPDGTVMYVLQGMRRTPGPVADVVFCCPSSTVYMLAVLILLLFPGGTQRSSSSLEHLFRWSF